MNRRKKILKAVLASLISTILLVIILDFGKHEFSDPIILGIVLIYFVVMSFMFYKTIREKNREVKV